MQRPPYVTKEKIHKFIEQAKAEDIGNGDHSTLACVSEDVRQRARLLIKDDCILAGVELAKEIFNYYDPDLQIEILKNDGDSVKKGDIAFNVYGSARSILTMERLVLNCMQRMSGIATSANELVKLVSDTKAEILDTRKTTPNFRMFEKWAVYIGGARNHRFGLFDMIMLKDNHNDFAGGIKNSVAATVKYLKDNNLNLAIEVETRNLQEVQDALDTNVVDVIMLDNMSIDVMRQAVKLIDGRVKTEASGGITKYSIKEIAQTGVDYISSGAIIYNAPVKDMSLKAY